MSKQKKVAAAVPGNKPAPLVSDDTLRNLYARAVHCAATASQCPRPGTANKAAVGREALLAAVTLDLRSGDTVIAAPADPVFAALRSASQGGQRAQLKKAGLQRTPQHHSPQLVPEEEPGASFILAADTAFSQRNSEGRLTVLFAGASVAGTAAARVAFGFAGAAHLPLLFIVETRAGEANTADGDHAEKLAPLVASLGFPAVTVDGADALALYRVAFESMKRARAGGGPTLIDARFEAVGPTSSRRPGFPGKQEPLAQLERHMEARGIPVRRDS